MTSQGTNKFKVFWWIRGVGSKQRKQGNDVIETEIDFFNEADAEELIQDDLDAQVPYSISGSTGHFQTFRAVADEANWKPSLPNFVKAHKEIMDENSRGVSNWGISKVEEIER